MTILDTYGSALAAYSLRLLRTAYAGSAIRVRRSSDDTEQDIGFSSGQLDESALTTFCGAGNGFVVIWYDQSGNSNDASQGTAARQPQIVSSGTVITGGPLSRPTVQFLGTACSLFTSSNALVDLDNFSHWSVWEELVEEGGKGIFCVGGDSGANSDWTHGFALETANASNHAALYANNTNLQVLDAGTGVFPFGIHNVIFNKPSSIDGYLYHDGTLIGTDNVSASYGVNLKGPIVLGQRYTTGAVDTTNGLNGYISESISWNVDQTSNRSAIDADLNAQYQEAGPIRISQLSGEVLRSSSTANARLTQVSPLAISANADSNARLTQVSPLAIAANADTYARISQVAANAIGANSNTKLRATQIVMYSITNWTESDTPVPDPSEDCCCCCGPQIVQPSVQPLVRAIVR